MNRYCTLMLQAWISLLLLAPTGISSAMGKDTAPQRPDSVHHIPNAYPKAEPFSQYGNPNSYVIEGKRYHVKDDNRHHLERGIASWYGMKFHGKRTSSGEIYDVYGMTAAHKTLPIPTYAEVKNLKNGKKVIVKINDRGPFVGKRVIDLSYAAAKKLGIVEKGTAPVEIRSITFNKKQPYTASQHQFLQVGAFKNYDNAWQLRQKVKHLGDNIAHIHISKVNDSKMYHVKIGPIRSHAEHTHVMQQLQHANISI